MEVDVPGLPCHQKTESATGVEGDTGRNTLPVATGPGGLVICSEPDEHALSGSVSFPVRQEPHLYMQKRVMAGVKGQLPGKERARCGTTTPASGGPLSHGSHSHS